MSILHFEQIMHDFVPLFLCFGRKIRFKAFVPCPIPFSIWKIRQKNRRTNFGQCAGSFFLMKLKLNREIHFVRFVFAIVLVELLGGLGRAAVGEYVKCDAFRFGYFRLLDNDLIRNTVFVIRNSL